MTFGIRTKRIATRCRSAEEFSVALSIVRVWSTGFAPGTRRSSLNITTDWLVLPPVQLRQFRIWRRDNQPIGYASWAYLSDDVAARFSEGEAGTKLRRLSPGEWKSGEQLWLVDVVSPFGGVDGMVRELREKVFAGQKVKTLQTAPDGSGVAVVEW